MIVKLIRMSRQDSLSGRRDTVYALTRYVTDADPWSRTLLDRDPVRSLSEYLVHSRAHGVEPGEKAGVIGTRNLRSHDLRGQQVEMVAIIDSAPRVDVPLLHIILSWQAGEIPNSGQLADTVNTVLTTTGLSTCPAIYAEHTNTSHRHLHIAIARIDPVDRRAAGSEWLIEDLHQSVAILEERHGWAAEPNALYYARNGIVFDAGFREGRACGEKMVRDASGCFITNRDWRGLPSDLVEHCDAALQASRQAGSWEAFHRLIEAHGIAYRKKGSGARIHADTVSVKASTMAPGLALRKLEARWGGFIAHPHDRNAGHDAYREAHAAQLKALRTDRAAAQARLDEWFTRQLALVVIPRNGRIAAAMRAERKAARQALDDAFSSAIAACVEARHVTVESWRAAGSPSHLPSVETPSLLMPGDRLPERPSAPPTGLRAEHHAWSTRYYDNVGRLVFTDHRTVIVVHRARDENGVDAALTMAAARWGTVRVTGSESFMQLCAERAYRLGIPVVDGDGKPLRAARAVVPKTAALAPPADHPKKILDRRDDPGRRASVQKVVADLQRIGLVQTRRRRMGDDGHRQGPLEIVIETDRDDARPNLRLAALFDEDPLVQAALENSRARLLADVGHHLRQFEVPLDKKAVIDALASWGGRGRPAVLAFEDTDFQTMLERMVIERADRRRATRKDQVAQADTARQRILPDRNGAPRDWPLSQDGVRSRPRPIDDRIDRSAVDEPVVNPLDAVAPSDPSEVLHDLAIWRGKNNVRD
jgi:hypothetical protein